MNGELPMTDAFDSPRKRAFFLLIIKYLALISLLHQLMASGGAFRGERPLLLAGCLLLAANEYARSGHRGESSRRRFLLSYAMSLILLACLNMALPHSGDSAYIGLMLIELLIFSDPMPILLLAANATVYLLPLLRGTAEADPGRLLLNLGTYALVGSLFRGIVREKRTTERLYQELETANGMLRIYSSELELATAKREQMRIAQELHDSIGHSLVALNMNLEFAHSVMRKDVSKAEAVITRTRELSASCLSDLRQAVGLLREGSGVETLRERLAALFRSFDQLGTVTFSLDMEDELDSMKEAHRDCLFMTVREAITNGIRHGGADMFHVSVYHLEEGITLRVHNNGRSCKKPLIPSMGLGGMESRAAALGGSVVLYPSGEQLEGGFTVRLQLPMGKPSGSAAS
jgi:signal transduction histidine kinase